MWYEVLRVVCCVAGVYRVLCLCRMLCGLCCALGVVYVMRCVLDDDGACWVSRCVLCDV